MAELVVYPDAHPEVSSIDGRVDHRTGPIGGGSGISWADLVAGAGTAKNDVLAHLTFIYMECGSDTNRYYHLIRGIFLFDTSPLPDDAQIISATLSLYGVIKIDAGNWLPDVNIYAAAPASNKALEAGDFDSLGSTPFCDTPIGYNDWNIAGYNDFVLNADGLAAISKTGVTKFGARNANYDVAGVAPIWQETFNLDRYAFTCYCAEKGDGFKPKLTITYSLPPPVVPPTLTTDPATDIVQKLATLNGTLDNDGGEACQVRFQYGLTIGYGTDTEWQSGKETTDTFEQAISGLEPNTTYHFRAQAKNSAGTASGADRTFTTQELLIISKAYALSREEL